MGEVSPQTDDSVMRSLRRATVVLCAGAAVFVVFLRIVQPLGRYGNDMVRLVFFPDPALWMACVPVSVATALVIVHRRALSGRGDEPPRAVGLGSVFGLAAGVFVVYLFVTVSLVLWMLSAMLGDL